MRLSVATYFIGVALLQIDTLGWVSGEATVKVIYLFPDVCHVETSFFDDNKHVISSQEI